jgi:modulator of FtsH protease
MNGYVTSGWENFFVAEVGASAALTGLLFVAVSINLSRVLAYPQLPGRAAETLLILLAALAASTFGLVPGQTRIALGSEIVCVAALAWLGPIVGQIRARNAASAQRHWMFIRVVTHELATLPFIVCGVSLLIGSGGGLYWLVPGVVLAFAASILNAWVLLVEIQR